MTKKTSAKKSKKYSLINELHEGLLSTAKVTKKGVVQIKRAELKSLVDSVFEKGMKLAAGGERVKFPMIGTLVRREVAARKGGKGVNPFTGETIDVKPRPASKKPRWSFPKSVKEIFANKKYW